MKRLALLLIAAFAAQAQQPVSKEKALHLAGNVHVIFEHKCNECHGSHLKKPEGKFGHVLDLKRLADNLDYIERGKPHRSELYRLVNDGEMPPDDHPKTPPLTGEEKEVVRRWIQAGAPHELPAELPKRTFTTPAPPPAKTKTTARITLDLRDRPAAEVFAVITKQTGLRIDYTAPPKEPHLSINLNQAIGLFDAISAVTRKTFTKVKSYYLGSQAVRLLDSGCRLAASVKGDPLYDLRRI